MTSLEELYLLAQVLTNTPDSVTKLRLAFSSAKEEFRKYHFPDEHEQAYYKRVSASDELLGISRNRWAMLEELVHAKKPTRLKSDILQNIRILSTIHKELTRVNQWKEQVSPTRLLNSRRQYLATGS
ncbi:MAG: hypothetical protein AAF824_05225 [Bacteroidota bacterium]